MTRFVANPDFQRELKSEPPYKRGVGAIAVRVEDAIELAALPFRDTGNYMKRVEARYINGEFFVEVERHFGHLMEFGSINNAPQANIRRGVKAAGLRFEDDRAALS